MDQRRAGGQDRSRDLDGLRRVAFLDLVREALLEIGLAGEFGKMRGDGAGQGAHPVERQDLDRAPGPERSGIELRRHSDKARGLRLETAAQLARLAELLVGEQASRADGEKGPGQLVMMAVAAGETVVVDENPQLAPAQRWAVEMGKVIDGGAGGMHRRLIVQVDLAENERIARDRRRRVGKLAEEGHARGAMTGQDRGDRPWKIVGSGFRFRGSSHGKYPLMERGRGPPRIARIDEAREPALTEHKGRCGIFRRVVGREEGPVPCCGTDGRHGRSDARVGSAAGGRGAPARLATGWLTLFAVGGDLFAVSPLLPHIAAGFGVSAARAGLAVTLFAFCYMASAPLLGRVADRAGRRRMLVICLCGFAAANLLTAVSASFVWLLAARMAAGAAAAGIAPSVYALVGGLAPPDRRATHLAIAVSGLLMSLSVAAPAAAVAGEALGWQSVFAGLATAGALLAVANRRAWPDERNGAAATSGPWPVMADLAPRLFPTVVWATALYAMYTYLGAGLEAAAHPAEEIAGVILFYGGGALVGVLLGGRLADRFGTGPVIACGLGGLGGALLLTRLALQGALPLVGCAFFLLSAVGQIFFPAQQAALARDFAGRPAAALAWNNSALFMGISLGALLGGQVLALADFGTVMAVSGVLALAGGAINLAVAARPVRPPAAAREGV